ncbi:MULTISPECIES: DUF692 domain-containing protein [Sorangium]|uniref:Uncharacterized protein n=1 Tax=Sorangium cellulosum TaxID=56 RepID=A0A4P2QKI0_SORCE|nr:MULTISPECIES: DUF692 domain-containing protein [Sorangium]AUX30256.1 hypothetical protein SOCE836_023550 [Sorangium cellulosum]WCQ89648.1 hypothetical protein NQZ70_02339 [Sorangium sp. Soce836]
MEQPVPLSGIGGGVAVGGVGVGFRPELAADLLAAPSAVDFVEVVAEACFASPAARREASAIARIWPVVPHGVKLSLGSAEGVDLDRARRLGALCRELGAPVVSEHVAFVRGGGREIGHLTALPYTLEAARVVARNVAAARRALPDIPLLLENAARTLRFPDDALDEGSFYAEVVARTGCDLLLDVGNVYANAVNAGVDPGALARSYPLERVAMIHVAGGAREHGFYFDTHAHPVPEPVFALLAAVLAATGPVPILLERDGDFPPFAALAAELATARALARSAPPRRSPPPPRAAPPPSSTGDPPAGAAALAAVQARVAELLTAPREPSPADVRPLAADEVARSRAILQRKRVDDALPLLPRLASHRDAAARLGARCVEASPRAPRLAAVADALRIAAAAAADERLAAEALVDRLLLRARFVGPAADGGVRPRLLPFIRRERLPGGRVIWAIKGMGSSADVRLVEPRR